MPQDLKSVSQAVQSQIQRPSAADPKSPSDVYLAYLDKADWDLRTQRWSLMFDMIPAETALPGLAGAAGDGLPPPRLPTIIFQPVEATAKAVFDGLPLDPEGEPAEGSWYSLYLKEGGDPKTQVVGDLFHPDTDSAPTAPAYGRWHIAAADLLALPGPSEAGKFLGATAVASPSARASRRTPRPYGTTRLIGIRKLRRYRPHNRLVRLVLRPPRRPLPPAPAPPPPGYGALGVMAIGQGGFNLFFDRGTLEPAFYYDAGYPLGFFMSSTPPSMRVAVGNAAFQGPIFQNAAGNLSVILSHWDWDHWRFGNFVIGGLSLGNLNWIVPTQAMSPTAANFLAAGVPAVAVPVGAPPMPGPNGSTIYKLQPIGAGHAFIVNNSGLAIRVPVDMAVGPSQAVLLTGDANFNFVPGPAQAGLFVIGAVHHGSNNHGAAANLPVAPGGTTGRIAYSYGVNPLTGAHPYGFPNGPAVAAYNFANWGVPTQTSTAEGPAINAAALPPPTGNVRIGSQAALPPAYAGTAFAAIGSALP